MTFDLTTLRRDDYGLFGPDSPSWKVWGSPTALLGFQRSVVLEHLEPFLTAAVADAGGIYSNPAKRLDYTLAYFLLVALGDGRTAIQASEHLMQIHAPMTGIEPVSGKRYSANSPDTQLWIHVTGWHSVLKAYEMFGPGPLSEAEERRYWAECAIAAELQTCRPEDVPRSREEVHAYFEMMRPKLCVTEPALRAMHYLLWTPRANAGIVFALGSRFLSFATISTLPRYMRTLGRFDQWRIIDLAVRIPGRIVARLAAANHMAPLVATAAYFVPLTSRVFRQHLKFEAPTLLETITPARARELYGTQGARPLTTVAEGV